MKNIPTLEIAKNKCVNCCSIMKNRKEELVTEINLNFNFNARRKSMKVVTVLSSIFKLGIVNPLFNENVQEPEESEVGVCESCANILGNLIQFYTQFNSVRQSTSYLTKQIEALDKFMTEILSRDSEAKTVAKQKDSQQQQHQHETSSLGLQGKMTRSRCQQLKNSTQWFDDVVPVVSNIKQDTIDILSLDETSNLEDNGEEMENDFEYFCPSPVSKQEFPMLDIAIADSNIETKELRQEDISNKNSNHSDDELSDDGDDEDDGPQIDDTTRNSSHQSNQDRKKPPRNFVVPIADGKFMYNDEWQFESTQDGTYKCSVPSCGKIMQRQDTMMRHIRKWHCTGSHGCETCGKSFISQSVLKSHSCKPDTSCFRYSTDCGNGKFLYRNEWPFEIHKNTDNEADTVPHFECGTCHTIRRGRNNISAHIRQQHAERNQYICEACGKSLGNKKSYESHMQIHSETDLICDICGKGFKMRQSLYAHKQAHAQKTYKCTYKGCDKVLTTRGGLYFHHLTHKSNGVQQHECPHCHRRYMHKHGLKAHILNNCPKNKAIQLEQNERSDEEEEESGRKKYKCDFAGCDKVLSTAGGIYFHRKTHECGGVKQNKCPYCHRSFMQKHGLKIHMLKYCKKKETATWNDDTGTVIKSNSHEYHVQ